MPSRAASSLLFELWSCAFGRTAETPGAVSVALQPAAAALGEVTVTAGADPGAALLRRVVARVRAQRAALGPYAVTAYQRTTIYTPAGDIRGVAESSS